MFRSLGSREQIRFYFGKKVNEVAKGTEGRVDVVITRTSESV